MLEHGSFAYIEVDIQGSGYSGELLEDIEESLSRKFHDAPVACRGSRAPAAGPSIVVDLVIGLANVAVGWAIEQALDGIKKSVQRRLGVDPVLHGIEVKFKHYDIRIMDDACIVNGTGSVAGALPYDQLIARIQKMARDEAGLGNYVCRVSLPCDVTSSDGWFKCRVGAGSPSVWLVEYSDGPRWPQAVYDEVNDAFLERVEVERLADGALPRAG